MLRNWLAAVCLLPAFAGAETRPVSMWLAEGERNTVYLLGSVHLLRREDHPLPAILETAYLDAESLVMELDMDDLDAVALQSLTRELGMLPDGQTLAGVMGESLYARAANAAAASELPLDMLAQTEPWFAALTLEQLILTRIGFNPLYGIEMHMAMKASQDSKPIEGLETVEEQIGFLDGLSTEAQIDLLLQTLENGTDIESEMDALIGAWRSGNTSYLEEQMMTDVQENPELYAAIVVDRNRRWTVAIEALLDDEDDYLVIVGALHLIGKDGVPAMLTERGVTVRQMHDTF